MFLQALSPLAATQVKDGVLVVISGGVHRNLDEFLNMKYRFNLFQIV